MLSARLVKGAARLANRRFFSAPSGLAAIDAEVSQLSAQLKDFARAQAEYVAASQITVQPVKVDLKNVSAIPIAELFPEFASSLAKIDADCSNLTSEEKEEYLLNQDMVMESLGEKLFSNTNKKRLFTLKERLDALFEEAESLPETVAEPDWAAWRGQIANTAEVDRLQQLWSTTAVPDLKADELLESFRASFLPIIKQGIEQAQDADWFIAKITEDQQRDELLTGDRHEDLTVGEFMDVYPGMREEIAEELDNNDWDHEYDEILKDLPAPKKVEGSVTPVNEFVPMKPAKPQADEAAIEITLAAYNRRLRDLNKLTQ